MDFVYNPWNRINLYLDQEKETLDINVERVLTPYFNQPHKCITYAKVDLRVSVAVSWIYSLFLIYTFFKNFIYFVSRSWVGSALLMMFVGHTIIETIVKTKMHNYLSTLNPYASWKQLRRQVVKFFKRKVYEIGVNIEYMGVITASFSLLFGLRGIPEFIKFQMDLLSFMLLFCGLYYMTKKTIVLKRFNKRFFMETGDTDENIYGFKSFEVGKEDSTKLKALVEEREQCLICWVEFIDGDILLELPCNVGHIFHSKCINQWVTKHYECPTCRRNIFED